jgi:hypothetical protein
MDTFSYIGTKKFNDWQATWPTSGDPTAGPNLVAGLLGNRHKLSEAMAVKLSNTNIGTLRQATYQVVRTDPTAATIANYVFGRPLFWADQKLFRVTYVAAPTSLFAGICLGPVLAAGNVVHICIGGDVGGLYASTLTKTGALNDPVVLAITASLATLDVLADATGWTNVQLKLKVGKVNEAPVVNQVKRIILTDAVQVMDEGIM